jgi:hypothetical protein
MDTEPSDYYVHATSHAFFNTSTSWPYSSDGPAAYEAAHGWLRPFVVRFWPVLRHYRPEIVGRCLAYSYDHPGRNISATGGFGLHMAAGDHPQDRDSRLGSYRDDGAYLELQAADWLEGACR